MSQLLKAFANDKSTGSNGSMLVGGSAGSGKSILVMQLRDVVVDAELR